MNLADIASIAEALAVVTAVTFGVVQLRMHGVKRRREASLTLMQSLQTIDMLRAIARLDSLPDNLGKTDLEDLLGEDVLDLHMLLGTWESLGIMVYHGEVTLDLVADFYSGPLVQSWHKLARLVEDIRDQTGRNTRWEFFQWLALQMLERENLKPPVPAYRR